MRIAILNYGVGNIFSLKKAFENVSSQEVRVLNQLNRYSIKSLDILVLPGVGHFSVVSKRLSKYKDVILEGIERGLGIFGVCRLTMFFCKTVSKKNFSADFFKKILFLQTHSG